MRAFALIVGDRNDARLSSVFSALMTSGRPALPADAVEPPFVLQATAKDPAPTAGGLKKVAGD